MNKIISIFAVITCFNLIAIECALWPVFNLFTRENTNNTVLFTDKNLTGQSLFSHERKTYFLVHGFNSRFNTTYMTRIKNALLSKEDANVFAVNWSLGAAGFNYFIAAEHAKQCARRLADFIAAAKIDPLSIHCVGHSLGAHICGMAGKYNKLGRITGLDPAGPLFKDAPAESRLDKEDAYYVDNIHGDDKLGIQTPIGHKDFYPNGGAVQCTTPVRGKNLLDQIKTAIGCSHIRPNIYFAESIENSCAFTAVKCSSYLKFKTVKCDPSITAQMGFHSNESQETGTFYLNTNANEPFCKNSIYN